MGHGFRSALRLAATVAAATAVARAAESARRVLEQMNLDPPRHRAFPAAVAPVAYPDTPTPFAPKPVVAPVAGFVPDLTVTANHDEITTPPIPHAFGPAPSIAPSRGIGFHTTISPAPPETTDVIELEASGELDDEHDESAEEVDEKSPLDTLLARRHASDEAPVAEPDDRLASVSARDAPAPASPLPGGQHRRVTGAVSGTVSNVYGRGIRGLRVEVVDEDKVVVASATTGVNGRFVVEDVPAGTFRLRALDDIDDDFETSWHGGSRFRQAADFAVRADGTRRGVDVVLRSKAQVDVDVTVTRRSADIEVLVTHRATGAPAAGTVELSTRDVDVIIPLVDGRASITLGGRSAGLERTIGRTLRVDYLGDHQTRPTSVKVRLL